MAIDNTKVQEILTLRAKGKSYAAIANETGVAKQSTVDTCKRYRERIATLQALELEELYERQRITSTERIQAHATLMQRIREEIDSRPLTDIPTDKLIDLYLKEGAALREEIIEPNFKSSEEQERDRKEREYISGLI